MVTDDQYIESLKFTPEEIEKIKRERKRKIENRKYKQHRKDAYISGLE